VSKNFRTCDLDQPFLLPPSLQDWLPENHLARFIAELVPGLDLSKIYGYYGRRDGRGKAAYHPVMMVRVLLYGYCVGVTSSRRIERASYDDIAFRYLCADQHPDHDTIADFRRQHLLVLAQLFTQVLQLCDKAGLVKLGHVAIDGTKLQANASKHKAMSYSRMEEKEKQLRAEVEKLLAQAEETDAAEDALYGKGNRGDDLTGEMARRESRLKKIAEAKAALEQEAREHAEAAKKAAEEKLEERRQKEQARGKKFGGHPPRIPDPEQARPEPTAQRNFTDPESRIMPDGGRKGSFVQAYNAQIVVDSAAQIIVAAEITQESNDKRQLAPMLEKVERNTGSRPATASADTGVLQRRTDHRRAGARHRSLRCHREAKALRIGSGIASGSIAGRFGVGADETEATDGAGQGGIQDAKGDCGTRLRADQGMAALPALLPSQPGKSGRGVEADLPHAQPAQAVSFGMGSSSHLKGPEQIPAICD
jgi:transposase